MLDSPHVHRALALECQHLARHPPRLGRQAHAAQHPAHGGGRSDRRGVSRTRSPARRISAGRAKFPTTRWSSRRWPTACTKPWTSTGSKRCCAASKAATSRSSRKDLPTPSPLAAEILTARPYAFLDDAPLEERRTNAVAQRRWLDPETAADMGKLDPAAIAAGARGSLARRRQPGRAARCAQFARRC